MAATETGLVQFGGLIPDDGSVPLGVSVSHQASTGLGQLVDGLSVVLHRLLHDLVLLLHGDGALLVLVQTRRNTSVS